MKTIRKTTWMNYLIIGISVFFLLVSSQCNKRIEPASITGNYIYINSTSQMLSMELFHRFWGSARSEIVVEIPIGDSVEFQMENQFPFPFDSKLKDSIVADSVIIRKGIKCLVNVRNQDLGWYDGNGVFKFKNYDNYSKELISQDNFKLYYTFNDEDFNNAQVCE